MSVSKSEGTALVTKYYGSFLFGVCWGPVTAFRGFYLGEKLALGTNVTTSRLFNVNQPELHGGLTKEGGAVGALWFMNGGRYQRLPPIMALKMYETTPGNAPGYRDICCIAITEFSTGNTEYPNAGAGVLNYAEGTVIEDAGTGNFGPTSSSDVGFFVGCNNPYLKTIWVEVTRASDGWFPETALVYRTPEDQALWEGGTPMDEILGKPDSNLVHVAYEAFTNGDWGMGTPVGSMDDAAWRIAAQTAYEERLGGSFLWTQPMTMARFAQMIADHIRAMIFPDPETGLISIRLIRGDYDEESLDILTPDNSDLVDTTTRDATEVVNEIVVEWTNPATEEIESVYAQDLASIADLGDLVSETHVYSFFRRQDLADAAASRDVLGKTAPLKSATVEMPPNARRYRPGEVVRVQHPAEGLADVTCRVMRVEIGKPAGRGMTLILLEDVFAEEAVAGQDRSGASGGTTEFSVEPPSDVATYTLPYYAQVQLGITPVDGQEYAAILVSSEQRGTYAADIYGFKPKSTGGTVYTRLTQVGISRRGELTADLPAAVYSGSVVLDLFGFGLPVIEGDFIMIGEDETEAELCLVTAVALIGSMTLMRGVLDTVSTPWPAGTPIWVVSSGSRLQDPQPRVEGEVYPYDARPVTFNGTYPVENEDPVSVTMQSRAERPLRPARVRIDNSQLGGANSPISVSATFRVSWVFRNRITEDTVILDWDEATVTPEAGTTITVVMETLGGSPLHTHTGLTGSFLDITHAAAAGTYRVRVWSVRDGLASFQEIHRMVAV